MLVDIHIILIPLCLLFAAMFAAAEASLFSLSRTQLEGLKNSRLLTYQKIRSLIFEPDTLLSTLIIGNECLNIMIGTFVVSLLESSGLISGNTLMLTSVVVSSLLLLTFSEILPKVIAFRVPVITASILVYPISALHRILTPLRRIFQLISGKVISLFGVKPAPPAAVTEKDFLALIEVGAESGSLEREEKERLINIFHFSDLSVSSVMTPWEKVFHLDDNLALSAVLDAVRKHPYSRIPVTSHRTGHVTGILYTKELIKFLLDANQDHTDSVRNSVFPPYIVSTHKRVARLFREFKQKKIHIALVVDEYGKQLGIVTLEDVLNALFQTQKKAEGTKTP